MAEQFISVTRSSSSMKPRVTSCDLSWFRSEETGKVYLGVGGDQQASRSDNWRSQINELPFKDFEDDRGCEGELRRVQEGKTGPAWIDYTFVGGFNNNALRVVWGSELADDRPLWIAVKTFTGFQVKYVLPDKQPPLVFAFADEDAYCYCDYDPCKECVFRCKNGFAIQAFFSLSGMVVCHCDRMDRTYTPNVLK